MSDKIDTVSVIRYTEQEHSTRQEAIATEYLLTVVFNNRELVTLLCSPSSLKELAVGFLFSEGLIQDSNEIRKLFLDERRGIVRIETTGGEDPPEDKLFKRLITSGCGKGMSFYNAGDAQSLREINTDIRITPEQVYSIIREFLHNSEVYQKTAGVHSSALCNTDGIVIFNDDIGRHNAIDKIFGECLMNNISTDDLILATTGRISSEILLKVIKKGIPIVISKSAPTTSGIKLAIDSGITLIGFVRGKRMNVYANSWRVV
ncbi:MAG: formate dehydrogenase accessory sulfurtransferase FdhD [Chloroflexota bacterium]|nr:formate dehydrogenase accessory sulfurtransferase FdhD [Chloroflexota bacterium]